MNNRKRPVGAVALGCLFLGAAFLPISYSFFKKIDTFVSWPYFVIVILPQIAIYLVCSLIVFSKWYKLSNCKKAILIGIGLQAYLLLLNSWLHELLIDKTVPQIVGSVLFTLNIILSPIESLYQKIIMSYRSISNELVVGYKIYHWESGLILPLMRLLFAGAIGGFVGKYIEAKKLIEKNTIKKTI